MANRRCRKRLNAEQQRGKSGELRCASWQWVHRDPEAVGGGVLQCGAGWEQDDWITLYMATG